MALPVALRVWWNHNRNIIFLIPMIVGIIAAILWSSTFPPYYQDWIIGLGVGAAFGIPGLLIVYFTVRAWQFSWFILHDPHLPDAICVPLAGIRDSIPVQGGHDRFGTIVESVRELQELRSLFPDVVQLTRFKIRSNGKLRDRIDMTRYGLVYDGGMPAIAHGVEHLYVAKSITVASGVEEGRYIKEGTFELRNTEHGDYAMMTNPRVQDAIWETWKDVLAGRKAAADPQGAPKTTVAKSAPSGVQAYCMTCKQKRDIKDPEPRELKNGKHGVGGSCPVCGTKLFAITGGKK